MYIYKTTNLINNKIYIGKCAKEIGETTNYFGSGLLIKLAIKKYGINSFKKDILYTTNDEISLNEMEIYYISYFNSINKTIGYNITIGGTGGDTFKNNPNLNTIKLNISNSQKLKWTINLRKKYSDRYLGENNPFFGKTHSKETVAKISDKMRGHIVSDNVKKKISDTLKNQFISGERVMILSDETKDKISKSHLGLKHSEEDKLKISEALSGDKNPSAQIWVFENKNGEKIKVVGEFQKFCLNHNLSIKAMRNIANGKRKNNYYKEWTVYRSKNEID